MALSEKEKAQLEALQKKKDAPPPPSVNKSVTMSVDPKDKDSVAFAIKHGFLHADEVEDNDDEGDDDDDDDSDGKKPAGKKRAPSKKPARRGYFD